MTAPGPSPRFPKPVHTGNVPPLLAEIGHALDRLLTEGTPTTIDLRGLPMTPDDTRALSAALGDGEVTATLRGDGDTTLAETAMPGVWRITHRAPDGAVLAELIEIAPVPALLSADPSDMARGRARLARFLDTQQPAEVSS